MNRTLIAVLVFLLHSCSPAPAVLETNQVFHAVAMEASGEPYLAKVGICAVIRIRGSLHGIYGANATRQESAAVYASVRKAWLESATNDPTHGCDMFGGICDDHYFQGKLGLKPVLTIGHTRFYRSHENNRPSRPFRYLR
jgi:hypothetical protein